MESLEDLLALPLVLYYFLKTNPKGQLQKLKFRPHNQNTCTVISLQASPRTMLPPDSGFLSQWGGTG
jgi:hypothetical protein